MNFEKILNAITLFIADEVSKRNSKGVVLGLSGGLDSSVVAELAVRAMGKKKVLGLILPDRNIAPNDTKDAKTFAQSLGIKYTTIDIGETKKEILRLLPKNKLAQSNITARLRMCIIYYYAGLLHRLVLGTSDKSETKLGYFTKYGDGAADLLPLGDLYKTEVRKLGEYLNIPSEILSKKSSPALWKGQTAEQEIGVPYGEIDVILRQIDNQSVTTVDKVPMTGKSVGNFDAINAKRVLEFVQKNKHKTELPPICKIRCSLRN